MNKGEEIILAIEKEKLYNGFKFEEGIITDEKVFKHIVSAYNMNGFSTKRDDVEYNPMFIQPVTYIIIKKAHTHFLYQRLFGVGPNRKYGVRSLGIGGHMNPHPTISDFEKLIEYNIKKEIEEEVYITSRKKEIRPMGLLIDNSDLTNQCHIAIIGIVEISEDSTVIEREADIIDGKWLTLEELKGEEIYHNLESWSQIIVNYLLKKRGLAKSLNFF